MSLHNHIRFERARDFPHFREGIAVLVSGAQLPCLTFSRVKVRKEIRRELGVVERFALQAGLRLLTFHPRHLQELTSIPAAAVVRFLDQLVRANTLASAEEGHYQIRPKQADQALTEAYTREEVVGVQNFLWLPRTNDLFAMSEQDKEFERLTRLQSVGQSPIPKHHQGLESADWLNRRIVGREVWNLDENILGLVPGATMAAATLPELCPVYPSKGSILEKSDSRHMDLSIEGGATPKHPGPQWVQLSLSGESHLCAEWRELAVMPLEANNLRMVAEAAGLRHHECRTVRVAGPTEILLSISSEASRRLFEDGVVLSAPFCLRIVSAENTCVEVRARYEPADRARALPFAIDAAVVDILQNTGAPTPAAAVESALMKIASEFELARADSALTATSLLDRLWSLGHYSFIYRARADGDFSYETTN